MTNTATKITVSTKGTSYYIKIGTKPPVRLGSLRKLAEKIEDLEAEVGTLEITGEAELLAALDAERDGLATADLADATDGLSVVHTEPMVEQLIASGMDPALAAEVAAVELPTNPADLEGLREGLAEVRDASDSRCEGCGCVECQCPPAGEPEPGPACNCEGPCEHEAEDALAEQAEATDDEATDDALAGDRDPRLPPPGTIHIVEHKGIHGGRWEILVEADGFVWNGTRYKSISGLAKAATGQGVNGFAWAGLTKRNGASQPKGETKKAQTDAKKRIDAEVACTAAAWLQTQIELGCSIFGADDPREEAAMEVMKSLIVRLGEGLLR